MWVGEVIPAFGLQVGDPRSVVESLDKANNASGKLGGVTGVFAGVFN